MTTRLPRLSLFLVRDTPFYRALLAQMLDGLREFGFEATGSTKLLDEAGAAAWMQEHRPEVVFEMNRPRVDAPFWPREVRHVTWIVDYAGRTEKDVRGSDITYFFDPGWVSNYIFDDSFIDHLAPGVCPKTYRPPPERRHESDAVFVGHVPPPWTPEQLARNVSSTEVPLTFGELLPLFVEARKTPLNHTGLLEEINTLVVERTGGPIQDERVIRYDLLERVPRMERQEMLDEAARSRLSLRLFGTPGLGEWPRFKAHYRGFLENPSDVCAAYQTSGVNIHDGVLMHFRALDGMRCGALLLYQPRVKTAPPRRGKPAWRPKRPTPESGRVFKPWVHYLVFGPGEFEEVARDYLGSPQRANQIRQTALEAVTHHHTWYHRAEKLAADLAKAG